MFAIVHFFLFGVTNRAVNKTSSHCRPTFIGKQPKMPAHSPNSEHALPEQNKSSQASEQPGNSDKAPLPAIDVLSMTHDDTPILKGLDDDEDSITNKEKHHSTRRYFRYALGLWIIQLTLVMSLKRLGFFPRGALEEINEALEEFHQYFNVSIDSFTQSMSTEKKSVGYELKQQGANANYPIVIVPGFVTSGLEVWSGTECARNFFRQRIWAAIAGAKSFLVERECWNEHMALDPYTGSDPENIRVRASEGFGATDYFMANYWVFGKLIENLAQVGYNPSNMAMQPYDWRLPFHLMEERDGFFTNLKNRIEALHKTTGKKVVLATHSMGAQVVHHFFGWVTAKEKHGGGGGGKMWVNKHLHSYINIAGSHLGVPKAATALLSGEMSDLVFAGRMGSMVESFFGRKLRRNLWSTWGSLWAMLPKGGDALWGPGSDMCVDREANDTLCPVSDGLAFSPIVSMTDDFEANFSVPLAIVPTTELNATVYKFLSKQTHRTEELLDFLQDYGAGLGRDTVATKFHSQYGAEKSRKRIWYDVTRSPLPHAPKLNVYCFYGTGLPTERAYYYKRNWAEISNGETSGKVTSEPVATIDADVSDKGRNISYGIKYTDGDGSVPLLSLGYVCADAWQRKDSGLNPSKSKVYTREYKHKSEFNVDDPMRGGPASSDHGMCMILIC